MFYTIAALLVVIVIYSIFKEQIQYFYNQILGLSQVQSVNRLKKYYGYHMI
jgi:hypothetical protein